MMQTPIFFVLSVLSNSATWPKGGSKIKRLLIFFVRVLKRSSIHLLSSTHSWKVDETRGKNFQSIITMLPLLRHHLRSKEGFVSNGRNRGFPKILFPIQIFCTHKATQWHTWSWDVASNFAAAYLLIFLMTLSSLKNLNRVMCNPFQVLREHRS